MRCEDKIFSKLIAMRQFKTATIEDIKKQLGNANAQESLMLITQLVADGKGVVTKSLKIRKMKELA